MAYGETIAKILGADYTESEGRVASLVLDFVANNPQWRGEQIKIYEQRILGVMDCALNAMYGVGIEKVLSKTRQRDIVEMRSMVYLFLRDHTNYSFPKIADVCGRDHSTIVWGTNLGRDLLKQSKTFRENYKAFENYCLEKL